ncbi:P-loop NTPase [Sulfurovum sp. bin170]|uniref:nucleotide-binding protein n=1 Tax=Sulfurovum sp. bin170 TaxID=2695268 RepID=UPI0013E0B7FD|nr:ATP-binding protein [Sulfurovum sp. bin170]NEW61207.1 P-loop NTPase [Sulfurovum sp. bin170]
MKITIASGKGGTGKTTISTNLVSYLSTLKQSVVLADLDVEEPNSALFLRGDLEKEQVSYKMIPKWEEADCTFCGECADVCNFNAIVALSDEIIVYPELCHSCYACSELCPTDSLPMTSERIGEIKAFTSDGFSFIEGRLDLGQEMAVPLIAQTIDYVDENFKNHIKIFDAPPGTSCPVIEASRGSDYVILVTESTPFGLNDLKLAVETMRVLNQKFGVIINRYGIGDNGVETYCADENIEIITKVKNDREVAKLYSKGELIYPKIGHFRDSLDEIVTFIGGLKCEK